MLPFSGGVKKESCWSTSDLASRKPTHTALAFGCVIAPLLMGNRQFATFTLA
jgi:hypothetical protein